MESRMSTGSREASVAQSTLAAGTEAKPFLGSSMQHPPKWTSDTSEANCTCNTCIFEVPSASKTLESIHSYGSFLRTKLGQTHSVRRLWVLMQASDCKSLPCCLGKDQRSCPCLHCQLVILGAVSDTAKPALQTDGDTGESLHDMPHHLRTGSTPVSNSWKLS